MVTATRGGIAIALCGTLVLVLTAGRSDLEPVAMSAGTALGIALGLTLLFIAGRLMRIFSDGVAIGALAVLILAIGLSAAGIPPREALREIGKFVARLH